MDLLGQREEIREYQGRYVYFLTFMISAFIFLYIRIWYLQILNGDKFYLYSQENSLKQEIHHHYNTNSKTNQHTNMADA